MNNTPYYKDIYKNEREQCLSIPNQNVAHSHVCIKLSLRSGSEFTKEVCGSHFIVLSVFKNRKHQQRQGLSKMMYSL